MIMQNSKREKRETYVEPRSVAHTLFLCGLKGKKWGKKTLLFVRAGRHRRTTDQLMGSTWKVMLMEPEISMQKNSRGSSVRGFSVGWSKNMPSPGEASSGELGELTRS